MITKTSMFASCAALALAAAMTACGGPSNEAGKETTPAGGGEQAPAKAAAATIQGKSGSDMTGTATFTTEGDKVNLKIDVSGLTPGKHAVHIHENGDCSSPDAESAGGHWNPTNEEHGKWGEHPFHLGDIGNIDVGDDGKGSLSMSTDLWSIGTGGKSDVTNHAIVVHAQPDDFKTQPAGGAGTRVGCGVIQQR